MAYQVEVPVFQGPVEALLELVSRHRLDICDISISQLALEFLEYVAGMPETSLEEGGAFLVLASSLMELKSEALLPVDEDEDDEELSVTDKRGDSFFILGLEQGLFREAAGWLEGRMEAEARFSCREGLPAEYGESGRYLGDLDASELARLARDLFARSLIEPTVSLAHMAGEEGSVEEETQRILGLLEIGASTFRRLTEGLDSKLRKILTLLALLELQKSGKVILLQSETFGDIQVRVSPAGAEGLSRPWWKRLLRRGTGDKMEDAAISSIAPEEASARR